MSWGERSCVNSGKCPIPDECNISTCNVDCREYSWDGVTKPDSTSTDRYIPDTHVKCHICMGFGCRTCDFVGLLRKK